ncbi:MAG: tetratricopeptide repeat protein [Sedimentisphaerales bacterium]|nr:tetratricopeptide repeat protein [Sedimentisphaerales bacterium]
MAARYFNWRLAIVLLVAVAVFAGAAFALRQWQRNTRAVEALDPGDEAYKQQDWDTAAEQFARYLTVHRDDEAVLLKYADAQLKRRPVQRPNWQQAVNAYRAVLRLDNDHAEATERLTELYLGMGTPGEAELIARPYLKRHDDDPDPNLSRMLGVALAQQRKYREAEEILGNLLREYPDQVVAYETIGSLAAARPEDFNRPAVEWYDEMVAKNPESALAYIVRAGFHLRNGEGEEAARAARADWERAQQEDLSDTSVRLRLTGLLIAVGEFDKAKEHLAALEASASGEFAFWRTRAELALRLGATEEMVRVAATGLEQLKPQPWDFMPVAAELFIRAGQLEKGRQCISQMRDKESDLRRVAFLEGLLASSEGRLREAVEYWKDAIAQGYLWYSSPLQLVRMPVRMMLSSAFSRMGDLRSAVNQLQALTSEMPDYWEGHLGLARLYSQARNWAQVIEEARAVQRLEPGQPEAVLAQGPSEAVLLELQARTSALGAAGAAAGDSASAWKDIEKRLAGLDGKVTGCELELEILRVQVAMTQTKLTEARQIFDALKSQYSSDLRVALLEGQLLVAEENVPGAIELMRKTAERFPQAVEPVQRLALLVNQQEDPESCESVVKQAVARMDQPPARRVLGLFLAELYGLWQQEDKLYQWLTDLARQFPDDIQIKRRLLACRPIFEDARRAQTLVDEIKSVEGEAGWQWRYEQARVWLKVEDFNDLYAQTTKLLQENLLSNPEDQASRLLLGMAHERTGRLQLAISAYREALSRSPDDVLIITRTVAALQKAGQSDEAHRILEDAKRRDLKHPALDELESRSQRTAVWDHLQHGDLELASDILKELVEKDPNDVSAGLELVRVMMQQGKLDDAEVLFREVKAKAPESFWVKETEIQLRISRGNGAEAIRLCDEVIENLGTAGAYVLRARTHAILQANEKAIADFSRAIETEPNAPGLWVERARFLGSLGRVDEAIEDSRKALDLAPESLPVQKFVMELYSASGRRALVQEANAMLDRALASDDHSADPQLKMYKVRRLLRSGTRPSLEEAEGLLEEVTEAEPTRVEAWELLGRLELQKGNPRRALDTALRGLTHNKQDKQLLLLKASAEAQAAQSAALAVPTLRQLAQKDPGDAELQRTLASALYRSGDKKEARSLLEGQMRAEPNSPAPMMTLLGLLASDGSWTELNEQVASWLDRHPDDDNMRTTVAGLLTTGAGGSAQAVKMAEGLLQTVLERNPKAVGALSVRAILTQTTGRVEESVALNRRILELDPNNVIAMNNLAWILCEENGQYQEALDLADRGLSVAPEYIDIMDTRGVIHYRMGGADPSHYEKAEADFRRCLELYPTTALAGAATRFHLARVYDKTARKPEALQEVQKALDLHDSMGGLSSEDLAEAKLLLRRLQGG